MKISRLLFIFWTIITFASCVVDDSIDKTNNGQPKSFDATLTLRIPDGGNGSSTRSLLPSDETAIKTVDVLVFRHDEGDNEDYFFYQAQTSWIEGDGSSKDFRISVKPDEEQQQFVVFANAHALIGGLSLTESMTRDEVLNMIAMEKTTAWNTTSGNYDPLPMWGQTSFRTITNVQTATATVDLIRTHARIDIRVADAIQSAFKLKKVWLYNSSTKGRLAPSDSNWDAVLKTVTDVTQPNGGWGRNTNALEYTVSDDKSLIRSIYSFEAPASTSNSLATGTCLVVGGLWNNESMSYYRIDFWDDDEEDFLPLMRNHLHEVFINNVSGNGFPSLSEALNAGFSNMTATTKVWTEGQMGHIVWDGRHWMTFSGTEYDFYPEEQNFNIEIATNYSEGWKAKVNLNENDEENWLSIQSGTDEGDGDEAPHSLTLAIKRNTDTDRTGYITVTAGRLEQTIKVFQRLDKQLSLDVGDVVMIFSAQSPLQKHLRIEWEPAANNCTYELLPVAQEVGGGNYPELTFTNNPIPDITDEDANPFNGGTINLNLKPDAIASLDTFDEHRSILRITAHDTDNNPSAPRDVLLRQFNYNITVSSASMICQLATSYSITIKSNGMWEVVIPSNNVIATSNSSELRGEPDTTTGENFTFTTGAIDGQTVTITFRHKENHSIKKDVTIKTEKNEPNCYIVNPTSGKNTIDIPIGKVYDVWGTDVDLTGISDAMTGTLTSGLLWQDATGLIQSVAAPTTQNKNATIRVTVNTNGTEGNAVVFLKVNAVIRWSWHIWVVKDFDPEQNTGLNAYNGQIVMDRDLGAIRPRANDASDIGHYGLLYQWGRKDPFPGAKQQIVSDNTTSGKTIYNISNAALSEGGTGVKKVAVSVNNNLPNSIANPLTFYTAIPNTNGSGDWYTNRSGIFRNDRWEPLKTVFDPCPEGWKVPHNSTLENVVYPANFETGRGIELIDQENNSVGYFPPVGVRNHSAGVFLYVGSRSHQWLAKGATGAGNTSNGSTYTITPILLNSSTTIYKACGYSVRCVKIK